MSICSIIITYLCYYWGLLLRTYKNNLISHTILSTAELPVITTASSSCHPLIYLIACLFLLYKIICYILGGAARQRQACLLIVSCVRSLAVCTAHSSTPWLADRRYTYCFFRPQSSLNCRCGGTCMVRTYFGCWSRTSRSFLGGRQLSASVRPHR